MCQLHSASNKNCHTPGNSQNMPVIRGLELCGIEMFQGECMLGGDH